MPTDGLDRYVQLWYDFCMSPVRLAIGFREVLSHIIGSGLDILELHRGGELHWDRSFAHRICPLSCVSRIPPWQPEGCRCGVRMAWHDDRYYAGLQYHRHRKVGTEDSA